ncbi:MAG: hypothetical protein JWR24_2504 [Actinoallomurus sp.]|jgi:hypothetical protein|nr:hypothetical protein [Actinoallomurus sp.]
MDENVATSPLKAGCPAGSPGQYNTKQIDSFLRSTQPEDVTSAGKAYLDLASAYEDSLGVLKKAAGDLAGAWGGPAAEAAQGQLQEMGKAAYNISVASGGLGGALQQHGGFLSWYETSMPPLTDANAHAWMQGGNQRIVQTWSAMPAEVTTGLPPVKGQQGGHDVPSSGSNSSGSSTGGGSGSSTGGSGGSGGSAGGHSRKIHGSVGGPYSSGSSSTSPGGTQLAGFTPSAGSSGAGGFGGDPSVAGSGIGGVGGSGASGVTPGGIGGFVPGVSRGVAGGGIGGRGIASGGLPGSAGALEAEQAAAESGAAGATGRSGVMGPALRGAGGGSEWERTRTTWLSEDSDIWGGDLESAPPVIGAPNSSQKRPEDLSLAGSRIDDTQRTAELLKQALAKLEHLEKQGIRLPDDEVEGSFGDLGSVSDL